MCVGGWVWAVHACIHNLLHGMSDAHQSNHARELQTVGEVQLGHWNPGMDLLHCFGLLLPSSVQHTHMN